MRPRPTQSKGDWTSIKKTQQPQEKKVELPPPVYSAFPHRENPLFNDVLPWVEKEAYFVLLTSDSKSSVRRLMHKNCQAITSQTLRVEAHTYAETHPVIIMDITAYPMLIDEYEWPYYIIKKDPGYVPCTCSYSRYLLEDEAINREHYKLEAPYFYLCNMNAPNTQPDNMRNVMLPVEVRFHNEQRMRG